MIRDSGGGVAFVGVLLVALGAPACGGSTPPPKTDEQPRETPKKTAGGGPSVSQELGSIDQRAVEQTFDKLQSKLETCHSQGRSRVEYLSGDVKVFLRIGQDGRVRYGYFDESTLGDRETERCLLDLFGATGWPAPEGGEAEVRNAFGWPGGSERPPTPWGPEKVAGALEADKDVSAAVEKCKAGTPGEFRMTAYVEPGDVAAVQHGSGAGAGRSNGAGHAKGGGKKGSGKKAGDGKKAAVEHGGRFKSIGAAPPGKDGAEKVDCVIEALKPLSLPSPGSYAAKVTFSL